MLRAIAPSNSLAERVTATLPRVAQVFESQLSSELAAVNELCRHVERYRGKMLRPMLVLAGGGVGGAPSCTTSHVVLAAVVEMIHMATLVHDDVLDEAEVRRGGRTLNSLRGNEAAVMLGDYLISNAFHLCASVGDSSLNQALGEVTNRLCQGELLQLSLRGETSLDEATYFDIIDRKTASLTGACCALGARLSGVESSTQQAMESFGRALGVAFQIQDDLLDLLGEERTVGKSVGRDLAKGKLTLPVVLHLRQASTESVARAMAAIRGADIKALGAEVRASGAAGRAAAQAEVQVRRAKEAIAVLSHDEARDLLISLADATINRSS